MLSKTFVQITKKVWSQFKTQELKCENTFKILNVCDSNKLFAARGKLSPSTGCGTCPEGASCVTTSGMTMCLCDPGLYELNGVCYSESSFNTSFKA